MSSTIFSGSSRYASDFSQIIDRAIAIAQLPLTQLNDQRSAIASKQSALTALETAFTNVSSAFDKLRSATRENAQTAELSEPAIAKATVGAGALSGEFTVEVLSKGSASVAFSPNSLPAVADPYKTSLSGQSSFTLTVDGVATTIEPAANTLASLAGAINSASAGVRASIINIGSSAAPDYRLSLQSTRLGPVSLSLSDGATDLVEPLTTGTKARYTVNGLPAEGIESDTSTVAIAPGLSLTLKGEGSTTVSVTANTTAVQDALTGFVTAYNAAVAKLDLHRGKAAGALSGDSIVSDLAADLRGLANFSTGNSGVSSLSSLGITFDKLGLLQFSTTDFESAMERDPDAVFAFLGDETSGLLGNAKSILDPVEDSLDGIFALTKKQYTDQLARQDDLIQANTDRIELMKTSLAQRMANADALIAAMEQQVTLFEGLFSSTSSKS